MSSSSTDVPHTVAQPEIRPAPRPRSRGRRALTALSFTNVGAVYVWLLIIAIFSIWAPATFPTVTTVKQILNDNSIEGLVALSVVIPLATRTFDLSVSYTMSLTSVIVADLIVHHHVGMLPAILVAIAAALLIGLINGLVVVVLRVDSFIATLASGSLIQAFITMLTNDSSITGVKLLSKPFSSIAQTGVAGVTLPVLYLVIVATAIWFVLERTATGRRLYAAGFNSNAARLQGVRTDRLRFLSLLSSAVLAGVAGVVFTSRVGSGSPTSGTPYLLAAYAAAFVGATQLRTGRFNAWGTIIAVFLLGTGVAGLGLATTAQWSSSLFTGIVLIVALVVTGGRMKLGARVRGRRPAPVSGRSD